METQAMISVIMEVVGIALFFLLMTYFLNKWGDTNKSRD